MSEADDAQPPSTAAASATIPNLCIIDYPQPGSIQAQPDRESKGTSGKPPVKARHPLVVRAPTPPPRPSQTAPSASASSPILPPMSDAAPPSRRSPLSSPSSSRRSQPPGWFRRRRRPRYGSRARGRWWRRPRASSARGSASGHGRLDRAEIGLVDIDMGELRAGFLLGQPDRADFGLREHRGRDRRMIDLHGALAEHGVGKGVALADRDGGQVDAVGDVADGVDVRHACLGPIVDRDAAVLRIDGDARVLQAEIGNVGVAADREHHEFGGDAGAVGQMGGKFLAVFVDLGDGAAGEDGDAALLHFGPYVLADVLVETAQDVVAAVDHGDVGAEAGENAGEFQRDVAAALDHDALRQFGQMKRLVGGDHMLDSGNGLAVVGRAAGGDQHVSCSDLLAVGEAERVGSSNTARVLTTCAPVFSTLEV